MNQSRQEPSRSSGMFILMLVALMAVGLFIVLNVLSFGMFTWVLAITMGIAFVGAFHYLLWGQDLADRTADDRETFLRQEARERERDEGWRS
jgi:fatty acid desaturase